MTEYLPSLYVYEIVRPDGSLIADLSGTAKNRLFSVVRNRAGQASFLVDLDEIQQYCNNLHLTVDDLFAVNYNELRIRRNNEYIWGGQINYIESSLAETKSIDVRASGFFDLLAKRYTADYQAYSAIDAGDIAWDLIDRTQLLTNGDFGIIQGAIMPSMTRDRQYEYANIQEEIIRLSEVLNGFDFEITYDKVFNVFYPQQGVDRSILSFSYPGNIKSIKVPRDGQKIMNEAIVRGQGDGAARTIEIVDKTDWQVYYKLRQEILDYPSVIESDTLIGHGTEQTNISHRPLVLPQVTLDGNRSPYLGSYWLGDTIKLDVPNVPSLYYLTETLYRIDEIQVTISDDDKEDVNLTLSIPV